MQHARPWLAEPLWRDGRRVEEEAAPAADGVPPLVLAWAASLAAEGTRRAYLRDARAMLRHLGVRTDAGLLAVRRRRVCAWRDRLQGELDAGRLCYQTCKRRMAAAASLFDYLAEEGHVAGNPVRRVRRPRPAGGIGRPVAAPSTRRTPPACPLAHCPARGAAADGGPVPSLLARLDALRASTIGRQLTLW